MSVASMYRFVVFLLLLLSFSCKSIAEVYFESDFEDGIKYLGKANAHSGGGYIVFLGGEIGGEILPGDGTQDYRKYNNVILDGSPHAAGASAGSKMSLKTQYRAGYEDSYQLNTTIIDFPESDDIYIRWYQKWSESWVWPTDQQKLAKIKGADSSQNFKVYGGRNYINLTKLSPAPYEYLNDTYIFSEWPSSDTDWRKSDSMESTGNFPLDRSTWYCLEVRVKSNTPGVDDAEFAYWIDGDLKFNYRNTNNRGNKTGGVNQIQMQHVLQTSGGNVVDTPTWMDNIVIANKRIGCVDDVAPSAPSNLSVIN